MLDHLIWNLSVHSFAAIHLFFSKIHSIKFVMPSGTSLSQEERRKILAFRECGLSERTIASKISRSKTVVHNFLKSPENYAKTRRPGRPSKLDERDKRNIRRAASVWAATKILTQIQLDVSADNAPIHTATVTKKWLNQRDMAFLLGQSKSLWPDPFPGVSGRWIQGYSSSLSIHSECHLGYSSIPYLLKVTSLDAKNALTAALSSFEQLQKFPRGCFFRATNRERSLGAWPGLLGDDWPIKSHYQWESKFLLQHQRVSFLPPVEVSVAPILK